MNNRPAAFITENVDSQLLNLYVITKDWVIRVPQKGLDGVPTTILEKVPIRYVDKTGGNEQQAPVLRTYPQTNGASGNRIVKILTEPLKPGDSPGEWVDENGVAWSVAVTEIEAAREYLKNNPDVNQASRVIGSGRSFA